MDQYQLKIIIIQLTPMQGPKHFITVHLALLGLSSVGKSAFCNAVLQRPFNQKQLSTIGIEIHRFQFICLDLKIQFVLYDSNGAEEERKRFNVYNYIDMFEMQRQEGKVQPLRGSLILASKTDQKSISLIDEYYNFSVSKNKIAPSLVGLFLNKNDVQNTESMNMKQIYQYADSRGISFEEGSSKTLFGIKKLFQKLSMKVLEVCLKNKVFIINQPQEPETPTRKLNKKKKT